MDDAHEQVQRRVDHLHSEGAPQNPLTRGARRQAVAWATHRTASDADESRRRLHQLAAERRRFGYKRLLILLREGVLERLIDWIDLAPDGISVTLHAAGIRSLVAELADREAPTLAASEPLLEAAE